jgi:hypothetical protein
MKPLILFFVLCSFLFILKPVETHACTAFLIKTKGRVLIGNNEDGSNPETRIWTIRAGEKGTLGRIYFGFRDLSPQGGINQNGLWFDAFGLPYKAAGPIRGKIYPGDLQDKLMAECSTVQDVIKFLKIYNRSQMTRYQWMFGDRQGNAIIVEADTIISMQQHFQVVTNFRQSLFPSGKGYECNRYQTAIQLLEKNPKADLNTVRKLLSDTHSEGQDVTLYSYIADLMHGKVYIYHFHNYENVVILDLKEELSKGSHVYKLSSLFPRSVAAESWEFWKRKEYNELCESRAFKNFDFSSLLTYSGNFEIYEPDVMAKQILSVKKGDRILKLQLNQGGEYELIPDSPQTFSMLDYGGLDVKCTFLKNEKNLADEIHLNAGILTIKAKRIE